MKVFFICSGFFVFSTVVYAVLGDGKQQEWAAAAAEQRPAGEHKGIANGVGTVVVVDDNRHCESVRCNKRIVTKF